MIPAPQASLNGDDMKVRMLVHMSGTRNGQEWPAAGEPMDLPDGEAADYIAAGIAEAAASKVVVGEPGPELEAAVVDTKPRARTTRPKAK